MTDPRPARRYRFGAFEADSATGELRRQGIRIKLNAQPFQVLLMLIERPMEVLTREEISRELWPDGTFVDYDHGVNSAINRIREALGDTASSPRFVETLARKGYRFVAPVERIGTVIGSAAIRSVSASPLKDQGLPMAERGPAAIVADKGGVDANQGIADARPFPERAESAPEIRTTFGSAILASPEDLPQASHQVVQKLFILMQVMYLGFYVGALANLAEIEDLFVVLPKAAIALDVVIVTAGILIPVRAFMLSAMLFHAPGLRGKLLKMWPFLLPFDELWALSPFLLLHHINFGLALACTALLVYSPFAQRSLVLMGAGEAEWETTTNLR